MIKRKMEINPKDFGQTLFGEPTASQEKPLAGEAALEPYFTGESEKFIFPDDSQDRPNDIIKVVESIHDLTEDSNGPVIIKKLKKYGGGLYYSPKQDGTVTIMKLKPCVNSPEVAKEIWQGKEAEFLLGDSPSPELSGWKPDESPF